jgi:hypothetical protein
MRPGKRGVYLEQKELEPCQSFYPNLWVLMPDCVHDYEILLFDYSSIATRRYGNSFEKCGTVLPQGSSTNRRMVKGDKGYCYQYDRHCCWNQ